MHSDTHNTQTHRALRSCAGYASVISALARAAAVQSAVSDCSARDA